MIMRFDLIAHILHTLLMKSLCSRKEGFFSHVQDVVLDNDWQVIPVGLSEKQQVITGVVFASAIVLYMRVAGFQLVITSLVERLRVCPCRPQGCLERFRSPQLVLLSPVPSACGKK